jgi:hypothetical protein
LVVFNKHVAGFSDILDNTQPMLESHPRFMKTAAAMSDIGEWRTIFRAKEDASRLIHVHVFLFNLYFESAKPKSKRRKA